MEYNLELYEHLEDVKQIISNIKEVGFIYIGDGKYTKDEILKIKNKYK